MRKYKYTWVSLYWICAELYCLVANMACGVIPSIRSIWWCYPTLRVLLSIFLCCSWWMFWYLWTEGLFLKFIVVFSLWYTNIYYKWYQLVGPLPLLWPHYIHYPLGYLPRYPILSFLGTLQTLSVMSYVNLEKLEV